MAEGLLTPFQTQKLLAGKPRGLCFGRYRILDQVGTGGTGPVFKAVHRTMKRVVALKVVHPRLLRDRVTLDLFTREVLTASQLRHPGIVAAYDAGVIRRRHFLAMEYVDGPSLQQYVQTHGPLPVPLACELMRQTAEALQYAHEKGMVHRDLKPANLLVARPSRSLTTEHQAGGAAPGCDLTALPVVKIIDFGLARLHHSGGSLAEGTLPVEPGAVWGTIDYIAPEQAQNIHAADIRSDLYSLGCTFYYALTGQVPFLGGTAVERLVKHLLWDPLPVTTVRPGIPAEVEAVVQRLMAKDPGRRFQTPARLVQELSRLARSGGSAPAAASIEYHSLSAQSMNWEGVADGRGQADRASGAASTVSRRLHPTREEELPIDAELPQEWSRWTLFVASLVSAPDGRPRISSRAFELLRKHLVEACEAQAAATAGPRREFFERLAGLVRPWLNLGVLTATEPEILFSLLSHCAQALRELQELAGSQATTAGDRTVLGGIFSLFKRRGE
jgi:serine/threonine protein kinase